MLDNKEIVGGELTDFPNEKYKKFFDKFVEIETIEVSQWKPAHLIGYFCKKYKETYNTDYKFKFNSPSPAKCFEVFQIKKMSMSLTSDPALLKEYIDWVYANKVIKAKRKLTSISFLTNEFTMNEYRSGVLLALIDKTANISRASILPEKYQQIFFAANMPIKTFGELAFMAQMEPRPIELVNAFNEVEKLGFDKNTLNRII